MPGTSKSRELERLVYAAWDWKALKCRPVIGQPPDWLTHDWLTPWLAVLWLRTSDWSSWSSWLAGKGFNTGKNLEKNHEGFKRDFRNSMCSRQPPPFTSSDVLLTASTGVPSAVPLYLLAQCPGNSFHWSAVSCAPLFASSVPCEQLPLECLQLCPSIC